MDDTATGLSPEAQTLTTDKIPVDQLAHMDDKGVLFFGVLPLIIVGVLAVAAVALYFMRKGKNWNTLGEAMRIDDGDRPLANDDSFNTKDIAEMDLTKPSQRIAELSRHQSKPD